MNDRHDETPDARDRTGAPDPSSCSPREAEAALSLSA